MRSTTTTSSTVVAQQSVKKHGEKIISCEIEDFVENHILQVRIPGIRVYVPNISYQYLVRYDTMCIKRKIKHPLGRLSELGFSTSGGGRTEYDKSDASMQPS